MSYQQALIAAGATVAELRTFGSYQGTWVARVTTPDGREGWLCASYGSCSGCDAFEAEFGYDFHTLAAHDNNVSTWDAPYQFKDDCAECQASKEKLRAFGAGYLTDLTSAEALAAKMLEESYWSTYDEDEKRAAWVAGYLAASELKTKLLEKVKAVGEAP